MKKIAAVILLLVFTMGFCACGKTEDPQPSDGGVNDAVQASGSDIGTVATPPASNTDAATVDRESAAVDTALYDTAKRYVGRPLDELLNAVGQPERSEYAASCLEENAEDGMLYYDRAGFYVWTVKNAEGETVHDVYLNG